MQQELFAQTVKPPLVIADGIGVDSMGVLIGCYQRGIRPDLNLHAWVGAEKKATIDYIQVVNEWCESVGFPTVTIVQNKVSDFKNWPPYYTLEENLLTNGVLSSSSYGYHDCSTKWKIAPQWRFVKNWQPAIDCWARGGKVRKAIGFEASAHEGRRAKRCVTYAVKEEETRYFDLWFPLREWGWDRDRCISEIKNAGLPVPEKSACYFCQAMKVDEIDRLDERLLKRLVIIEARAMPRLLAHAEKKGWPNGVGVPLVGGIWRRAIKGCRGATPRPASATEYIRQQGLLPAAEIERLIAATPKELLYRGDFEGDWQTWLDAICYPETKTETESIQAVVAA